LVSSCARAQHGPQGGVASCPSLYFKRWDLVAASMARLGSGVQHGKVARMCHERGLAQGDVAPVSVTCWEHTIPSRGPTDQGLQGYRVSSLLCPRYVAVTGVAKRLIQTVSGRPEVYISALHARPRRAARARAPATWLPRPAFKSGWFLRYCCCMAPHNAPNCSALLLLTTIAQDHAL
jgi:hypothetical protein